MCVVDPYRQFPNSGSGRLYAHIKETQGVHRSVKETKTTLLQIYAHSAQHDLRQR